MNEKVKKVLRIAGIVGICALLFACGCGLGYCSAQKTGEPNKVLTERSRKNAKTTTENGGYDKYTFNLSLSFEENKAKAWLYSFDTSTWTPTLAQTLAEASPQNRFEIASYYNTAYETTYEERKSDGNIYLLVGSANTHFWNPNSYTWTIYVSFLVGLNAQNSNQPTQTFICTSNTTYYSYPVDANSSNWGFTTNSTNRNILISYNKTDVFFQWNEQLPTTITFQDVRSYYLEQGYQDGYDDGEADGYGDGFEAGSGTGKMFTYLGVNPMRWYKTNLTMTDQTDTSVTYRLLTFKDGENASWSIYAINNISTAELNNLSINLYKGTSANSATFRTTLGTGTETTLASGIWDVEPKDYATFSFAQIIDVYNNSLAENYFLFDGIPENATGYQMGYQKGWNDGYNASPGGQSLDNVFSIFTKAFDATASFFNMKVFGFLPLYWFFLIPIFVAVITLLMRMIKH